MFFLLAKGFYFGLTEAGWHAYRGWGVLKSNVITGEPVPGITVGYRRTFKTSLWFWDWNFLDLPYQRGFRIGKFLYDKKIAVYSIVNPITLMWQSRSGEEYDLAAQKRAALGVSLGAGFAYQLFKNMTVSLEYVFQINYTPVFEMYNYTPYTENSTWKLFIRNRVILGIEFHSASRNG